MACKKKAAHKIYCACCIRFCRHGWSKDAWSEFNKVNGGTLDQKVQYKYKVQGGQIIWIINIFLWIFDLNLNEIKTDDLLSWSPCLVFSNRFRCYCYNLTCIPGRLFYFFCYWISNFTSIMNISQLHLVIFYNSIVKCGWVFQFLALFLLLSTLQW